jgi:hypothetical protein
MTNFDMLKLMFTGVQQLRSSFPESVCFIQYPGADKFCCFGSDATWALSRLSPDQPGFSAGGSAMISLFVNLDQISSLKTGDRKILVVST